MKSVPAHFPISYVKVANDESCLSLKGHLWVIHTGPLEREGISFVTLYV